MKWFKISENEFTTEDESRFINLKQLINLYKLDQVSEIMDDNGLDVTKEILLGFVLRNIAKSNLIFFLTEKISDEELDDMVRAGDFDTWNLRRNRRGRK